MSKIDTRGAREGLRVLAAGIVQACGLAMTAAIQAAEKSAKSTTLWKDGTGETRGSIRGERTSLTRGFVTAGGASIFLENGTQRHWIGSPVLIRGVGWRYIGWHPGTAERPFMAEARRVGEQALAYGLEYFVNAAIARA